MKPKTIQMIVIWCAKKKWTLKWRYKSNPKTDGKLKDEASDTKIPLLLKQDFVIQKSEIPFQDTCLQRSTNVFYHHEYISINFTFITISFFFFTDFFKQFKSWNNHKILNWIMCWFIFTPWNRVFAIGFVFVKVKCIFEISMLTCHMYFSH